MWTGATGNWPDRSTGMGCGLKGLAISGETTSNWGLNAYGSRPLKMTYLRGILALEITDLYCWEQGIQAYSIEIPERYLEGARGGDVSVVYDKVGCSAADQTTTYQYTWILWLSKKPFGE